jgi:3-deoxy-D-manno-octulosonate 8-phosphate phosphatase (KDO 8-P phosphatase)
MEEALRARLTSLKLMAFDIDGVMTDGRLYYTDSGEEIKAFHVHDGQGLKMLRDAGVRLAIITSRRSSLVDRRARDLGVTYCYQGVETKIAAFEELLSELKLGPNQAGFMGDDLLDAAVLARAGFAATVPHAPARIREIAHVVSTRPAGEGAVREVCELILEAQGKLASLQDAYFK